MSKLIKKITNKIKKQEAKARGIITILDVTARIIACIGLYILTKNLVLQYVCYYIGTSALLEIVGSVYDRNAKVKES